MWRSPNIKKFIITLTECGGINDAIPHNNAAIGRDRSCNMCTAWTCMQGKGITECIQRRSTDNATRGWGVTKHVT